jgi:2-polyprenyl-6-methoxyphenol hydroxylase-like FAD-dependent oxidoreductase
LTLRALVVGGGIGGLAAAVALRQAGVETVVLEQARALEGVGYGLALSPNALLALEHLGLANTVREHGARPERIRIRSSNGRTINEVDLKAAGLEMLGVHRADLQTVLSEAAGESLRLDARVLAVRADDDRVVAELAHGGAEEADVLIGADGIDSIVRSELHGAGEKRFAGHVGWRASVVFEHELLRGIVSESWGPGGRFGLVPIGHGRLYWFAAESAPPGRSVPPEGAKAALLRRFESWHEPIASAIEATEEATISVTDVYDRKPIRYWGRGRVTLLGDAAHPMTPNLGQGAAQALEDAVVVANRLRDADDVEAALRAYEARRIPRTEVIVNRSWQLGRLAQVQNPVGRRLRDALFRTIPERVQRRQQERIVRTDLS